MIKRPVYFESVRAQACRRWDQLEQDPDLAAPWHQLFKQVQNPRHVVSELLQNADDAGATEASVALEDGEFVFSHNGEDFTEEHFGSLCRFGYSNKRALHTIGFRGIGFKSIFSLGDQVHLSTPTLSIAFLRGRFTQPVWLEAEGPRPLCTMVRVRITDEFRRLEVEKNLREWLRSPASLLFFRNIRRFVVATEEVHWRSDGPGPVQNSEWMRLSTAEKERYLVIHSREEDFPAEALAEIRQERMVSSDGEPFPPCQVEIVLGMEGHLFVVLQTGVTTCLPFACNAPFVQDPARVKIKDPEISPTNRWLLRRAGVLAAEAMLEWLGRTTLDLGERAGAYQLFPDVNRDDNTLEGSCATIAEQAFEATIQPRRFLLCEDGELVASQGGVAVPPILLDVWSTAQVSVSFVADRRSILANMIAASDLKKLLKRQAASQLDKSRVVNILETIHLPKPASWRQLLSLWSYVAPDVSPNWGQRHTGLRIIPVEGSSVLHAGSEVVRIADKSPLRSQDDWEFLAKYLWVLNQDWLRFLAEQRRKAAELQDDRLGEDVASVDRVLRTLELNTATDSTRVIELVGAKLFTTDALIADCVRLAHISAALGAKAPANFKVFSCSGHLGEKSKMVVDLANDLDLFVTQSWYSEHVLDPNCQASFSSCTKSEWETWVTSGRAGLDTFVRLHKTVETKWTQAEVADLFGKRGFTATNIVPERNYIRIEDWDFDRDHWLEWRKRASGDPSFWSRLVERVLKQPTDYWSSAVSAKVLAVVRRKRGADLEHTVTEDLCPAWIANLRGLPCLQDTWGGFRQPAELLHRTSSTEAFLGIEPFVRAELDTEDNRPFLVRLGVRDTPAGPESILARLRALAGLENAPVQEVSKWYQRLDQLLDSCSTGDLQTLNDTFESNRLILTENCGWAAVSEVFLAPDEDAVPGAAIVHPSARHLALWPKVGVAPQPNAELAIAWLMSLPCGQSLQPNEYRRVKSLLSRYPERIWTNCGRWLNIEGQWVSVTGLDYAISMRSLFPWKHLFTEVKQKTADLTILRADVCRRDPFSGLVSLSECIEEHLQREPERLFPQEKPWLTSLGEGLTRVILEDEAETERIRRLAARLAATRFQFAPDLETVPYIAGVPAGTARRIDVVWSGFRLYVAHQSPARAAAPVAQEVARVFDRNEIIDACKLCYERTSEFVHDYLQANFRLGASMELASEISEAIAPKASQLADHDSAAIRGFESQVVQVLPPSETSSEAPGRVSQEIMDEPQAQEAGLSFNGNDGVTDKTGSSVSTKPRTPRPEPAPSLMERFAYANGFSSDGPERYYHADGRLIRKVRDAIFPWELYSSSGQVLRRYWPKDHCLELSPLQLDAEIWRLCDRNPDEYSLILQNPSGAPVEIPGGRLREMHASGRLTLHAATYRIVLKDGSRLDTE